MVNSPEDAGKKLQKIDELRAQHLEKCVAYELKKPAGERCYVEISTSGEMSSTMNVAQMYDFAHGMKTNHLDTVLNHIDDVGGEFKFNIKNPRACKEFMRCASELPN